MNRWLGNLIAMAVGLVMALLLLEAGLRVAGFRPYSTIPDPFVGQRLRPGAPYAHVGEEGRSRGRYNADGWRDVPHLRAKPPGTTRILVVGDSYVAAFQVPLDSTFHRRLERLLNARARPGHHFEVIAEGQNGNSTTVEYLTYLRWGAVYDPDVVAVLFVQNDPADNWKPAAMEQQRPFLLEDGDSLRLDFSFRQDPGFRRWMRPNWLRDHTALWTALRGFLARRRKPAAAPATFGPAGVDPQGGYYSSWNFDRRVLPDTLTPFRLTERIYDRFARQVRADGRRFVVFHVGFGQQDDRATRDSLEAADPNFDENKSARWLLAVGERGGFPVIPLSPAFRAASDASGGRPLWFGTHGVFGHWNSAGHAVAAAAMARYFARTLPGLDTTGTSPDDVPGLAVLERSSVGTEMPARR